jgi:hypothetical protein
MASGFGVDPTKDVNGNITSGTTSSDIQTIFGALFSSGLVSGGTITTSSSAMTYAVAAGVAIIPMASGLNIPAPIPATTVTVAQGPSSGTRTDIVYVQQRTPAIDGDSTVVIGVAAVLPPRAVALQTYSVPAGAATTSVATAQGPINFAIPYGGGLGKLYDYTYTTDGQLPTSLSVYTNVGYGTITLPTDRTVRLNLSACLSAVAASLFDNSKYCEYSFYPIVDNTPLYKWSSPGLHQAWLTSNFMQEITLGAGTHQIHLQLKQEVGPGTAYCHYGTDPQGYQRPGIHFWIEDVSVAA